MSRNKQRTVAATDAVAATTATTPTAPASLSYVTPTEFVELPSRGQFYSTDHPLYEKDVIEMRYMTAKDEDILTSPALLKKGVAIDRLLQNLVVDKNINPNNLLIGDKNAMLLAARISGYGEEYSVNVKCASCGEVNRHQFDLSVLQIDQGILPDENSSVSLSGHGTFVAELPKSKFSVEFRLLTGEDEIYLQQSSEKLKKYNLPEASATNLLKRLVVSVNGVEVASEISDFIENMPAQDARFLRACVQTVTPNVDMSQEVECSSCGAVTEMEVPFTSEFFWPQ